MLWPVFGRLPNTIYSVHVIRHQNVAYKCMIQKCFSRMNNWTIGFKCDDTYISIMNGGSYLLKAYTTDFCHILWYSSLFMRLLNHKENRDPASGFKGLSWLSAQTVSSWCMSELGHPLDELTQLLPDWCQLSWKVVLLEKGARAANIKSCWHLSAQAKPFTGKPFQFLYVPPDKANTAWSWVSPAFSFSSYVPLAICNSTQIN